MTAPDAQFHVDASELYSILTTLNCLDVDGGTESPLLTARVDCISDYDDAANRRPFRLTLTADQVELLTFAGMGHHPTVESRLEEYRDNQFLKASGVDPYGHV
jgi:hypothetical protein